MGLESMSEPDELDMEEANDGEEEGEEVREEVMVSMSRLRTPRMTTTSRFSTRSLVEEKEGRVRMRVWMRRMILKDRLHLGRG